MKITDLDEGFLDNFFKGSQASGLNNIGNMVGKPQADQSIVATKAKELLDQGKPQQQVMQELQTEFGIVPRIAQQAINMVVAGLVETTSAGSVAAVAAPMGKLQKRNMYNADGTMKNALDTDSLLGGSSPKKNKTSKKA